MIDMLKITILYDEMTLGNTHSTLSIDGLRIDVALHLDLSRDYLLEPYDEKMLPCNWEKPQLSFQSNFHTIVHRIERSR